MTGRTALEVARQCLRVDPLWWAPLVERYGVSAKQCYELGKRQPGRRPTFPRGPIGMTYDEIWHARRRETPAEIAQFYADLGSWPVFRQVYRRRFYGWPCLERALPRKAKLIEYGCGVAPATFWLSRRRDDFTAILVDVPGEAIDFAQWRLKRYGFHRFETRYVVNGVVPTLPLCEVAVVSEVLEHVPSPIAVVQEILSALRPWGTLLEDFHRHDHPSPADLDTARVERDEVYRMIRARCPIMAGRSPDDPDGGGLRIWTVDADRWSADGDRV